MDEFDDFEFDRDSQSQTHLKRALISSTFTNITDSIIDTHSAVKVLAITVAAELGAFAMFYVSKDKVLESLNESEVDVWVYSGAVAFVIGFLTAFAAYRLIAIKWPHQGAALNTWLVSFIAGLLNLGLFFAILTLQMK